MEIVLIRHGQPKWVDGDQYDLNPGLTKLGKIQADKSASIFSENSFDELWVSCKDEVECDSILFLLTYKGVSWLILSVVVSAHSPFLHCIVLNRMGLKTSLMMLH